MHSHNRYKTLPAHGVHELNRYKTLPAPQKTPKSAHVTRAGRKLSRSGRKLPEQGELFPAGHHTLATQRTLTGTKLSGHAACKAATGTKLSPHTAYMSSTGTKLSQHRENAQISPYDASREKIIPVETRSRRKQPRQGEFSPAVVPVPPLHTERGPAKASPVSSHGNLTTAKASPVSCSMHPPHGCPMRTPPQNRMQFHQRTQPQSLINVGISTILLEGLKRYQGNCMRNC